MSEVEEYLELIKIGITNIRSPRGKGDGDVFVPANSLTLEIGEPIQILYGLNGAGKSVSLDTIRRAMTGATDASGSQVTNLIFRIQERIVDRVVTGEQGPDESSVRRGSSQALVMALVRNVLVTSIRRSGGSDLRLRDLEGVGLRDLYQEAIICYLADLPISNVASDYAARIDDHGNDVDWHEFSEESPYFGSDGGSIKQRENVLKRRSGGEERWFADRIKMMATEISEQGHMELVATSTGWSVYVSVSADGHCPTVREEMHLAETYWQEMDTGIHEAANEVVTRLSEELPEDLRAGVINSVEGSLIEEFAELFLINCENSILFPIPLRSNIDEMMQIDSLVPELDSATEEPIDLSVWSRCFLGFLGDIDKRDYETPVWAAGDSKYSGLENDLFPVLTLGGKDLESLTRIALDARRAKQNDLPDNLSTQNESLPDSFESNRLLLMMDIGARATTLLSEMLPAGPSITLGFATHEDQVGGIFELWRARDMGGEDLLLAELSYATNRLAGLAIQIALAEETRPDDLKIFLLDEPDLGLHRSAERVLFAALERLAANPNFLVVVATHSPLALGLRTAKLHHVTRNDDGGIDFKKLSLKSKDQLHVLGLSISDTLALTRVFMIVEGRHDEIVFSELFADIPGGFRDLGIEILPMHGGRNAGSVIDSTLLWDYTDAKVAVVLDRVPHETLSALWEHAVTRVRETADSRFEISTEFRDAVTERMSKLISGSAKPDEISWITNLGTKALESGRPERLALLGLPEDDILAYVPPDLLGAADWKKAKKNLTEERLRAAVHMMGEVPQDLTEVYESVARLAK